MNYPQLAPVQEQTTIKHTASISVIIRTKNRPLFLARALSSLQKQKSKNFETIIFNDGGDVHPVDLIVSNYDMPNPKIIHNANSVGRGAAFNLALKAASGLYVACLDDDDTYDPDFCSMMAAELSRHHTQDPRTLGVICRCEDVYEDFFPRRALDYFDFSRALQETNRAQLFQYNNADNLVSPFFYFVGRHDFLPVQTLFLRDALLAEGGFREDRVVLEDKPTYFRLALRGRIYVVPHVLAFHHNRNHKSGCQSSNTMFNNHYDWGIEFDRFHTECFYDANKKNEAIQNNHLLFPLFREAILHLKWELRGEQRASNFRVRVDWKDAEKEIFPYMIKKYWKVALMLLFFTVVSSAILQSFVFLLLQQVLGKLGE